VFFRAPKAVENDPSLHESWYPHGEPLFLLLHAVRVVATRVHFATPLYYRYTLPVS
jgi:hypothetical protein